MSQLYQIQEPAHKKQQQKLAIGIDLGTTNSVVAFVDENKIKLLEDENHNSLFKSVVNTKCENNKNLVIKSVKRLIGKTYADAKQSTLHQHLEIIEENNRAKIKTLENNYTPEELSSLILQNIKNEFRDFAHHELEQAVITVPAFFGDNERNATQIAAELAGIKTLRLINEPTAALLAYGLESEKQGNYIVYDLGGGTFDVSVLSLVNGVFQVKATSGDVSLGGDDFDILIAKHFGLENDHNFIAIAQDLKHKLTYQATAISFYNGTEYKLSNKEFLQISEPLINKTLDIIKKAVEDSNLDEINGIVLVGGSTKMPIIKKALTDNFSYEVFDDLNPDTIVAKGAAIQADKLLNKNSNILLVDVNPISLGIETMGGLFERIIDRNTPVPTAKGQVFSTFKDGQSKLAINIYQGEREMVKDCHLLGKLVLDNIPPMPAGMPKIKITFIVNENAVLQVKAVEETTGIEQSATIKSSISAEDSLAILKDSMFNAKQDFAAREFTKSKVELEQVIQASYNLIKTNALPKLEEDKMLAYVNEIENSIDSLNTKEELDNQRFALEDYFKEIVKENMNSLLEQKIVGKNLDDI